MSGELRLNFRASVSVGTEYTGSAQNKIEENRLNIQTYNFSYDDKPYNIMKMTSTMDGGYYYSFQTPNTKVNLQSGRIQNICQIPGCAHTYISPNCINYQNFISPIATNNGIYYIYENQVMLLNENTEEVVIKNNFYTDYEKEIYPDNKSVLSALTISNDVIYIIGPTYFFTYDINLKEISEPHKLCDNMCMSLVTTNNYLYYTNESLELYQYNIKLNSAIKLDDMVGQVSFSSGQLYYIKYENEIPALYTANENGTEKKKLIDDCWVNYYIKDDYIYYQSFCENKNVYVVKLNGENKKQIVLKYNENIFNDLVYIVSTYSHNKIFIINDTQKIIFVFEVGSSDYKSIVLEEE